MRRMPIEAHKHQWVELAMSLFLDGGEIRKLGLHPSFGWSISARCGKPQCTAGLARIDLFTSDPQALSRRIDPDRMIDYDRNKIDDILEGNIPMTDIVVVDYSRDHGVLADVSQAETL